MMISLFLALPTGIYRANAFTEPFPTWQPDPLSLIPYPDLIPPGRELSKMTLGIKLGPGRPTITP